MKSKIAFGRLELWQGPRWNTESNLRYGKRKTGQSSEKRERRIVRGKKNNNTPTKKRQKDWHGLVYR